MLEELAIQIASEQRGVVAAHQLAARGASRADIRQLTRSKHWVLRDGGVYVRRGTPRDEGQAVAALVVGVGPGARLSHLSAANWLGQAGCALWPAHAVVGSTTRPRRLHGTVVHRVRELPDEWTTVFNGVPVVRPELCVLQLFAVCTYERAERITESLWADGAVSAPSLRAFIGQLGRRGRNGTAGVRRYLDERPDDYVPSASNLEARVGQILRAAGIEVRRQIDVGSDLKWTGRVDFVVVGRPVVIEVQSWRYHSAFRDVDADARRRSELEGAGFVWAEVWDRDAWSAPWKVVETVRSAIRRARALPTTS